MCIRDRYNAAVKKFRDQEISSSDIPVNAVQDDHQAQSASVESVNAVESVDAVQDSHQSMSAEAHDKQELRECAVTDEEGELELECMSDGSVYLFEKEYRPSVIADQSQSATDGSISPVQQSSTSTEVIVDAGKKSQSTEADDQEELHECAVTDEAGEPELESMSDGRVYLFEKEYRPSVIADQSQSATGGSVSPVQQSSTSTEVIVDAGKKSQSTDADDQEELPECAVTDEVGEPELESMSDGSEYVPEKQFCQCGVANCAEDIFLGCSSCPAFLCFDHMYSSCADHTRERVVAEISSSDSCVSDTRDFQRKKRKREKVVNLVRHNKGDPDKWKKNKRKLARLRGQEHINTSGKFVPAKSVVQCACHHGRQKVFRCEEFTEEARTQLHAAYYGSDSYSRQRDFILRYTSVQKNGHGRRKKRSLIFFLPLNGEIKRVCKIFFLKTLSVSEKLVLYTIRKAETMCSSSFSLSDMRGHHQPHNKTSDELLEAVRLHIQSFPTMEPHYTRSNTARKFLGSELNITKMYELYEDDAKSKGQEYVKIGIYRRVFCDEFNLSFHRPKKDMCGKCEQYENATDVEKGSLEEEFRQHIRRKSEAREEKERDKALAKEKGSSVHAVTMDLQSVLSAPCGNVSALYYTRKISVYNFTIYNQATNEGYCMIWDETKGKRGAVEIGSLLFRYLRDHVPSDVKHVIITSDSTVAQNRNQYIAALLFTAVQCLPGIETIEQKFLEPGHTEMEVDSMHSTIDSHRKHLKICSPYEWPIVLRMARREKPYHVHEVERSEFFDLHCLPKSLNAEQSLKLIPWMKVKCIKSTKGVLEEIEVKEEYNQEYKKVQFTDLRCAKKLRTRSSKGQHVMAVNLEMLKPAYLGTLPVSVAKKADLLKLCKAGVIKTQFHSFYENLQTAVTVPDCLPEPDCTEED